MEAEIKPGKKAYPTEMTTSKRIQPTFKVSKYFPIEASAKTYTEISVSVVEA